ncbi:MAG: hypothetical protein H6834_10365 [Planctomycetes bacterium]|nr:hypothetical protein [Planctomycetota bacterium]
MNATKRAADPVFMFGVWGVMYGCDDRFGGGYNPFPLTLEEVFEMAAGIEGLTYLCGHFPGEFPDDPSRLLELARTHRVGIGGLVSKTFGASFKNGGLSAVDDDVRRRAIDTAVRCLRVNAELASAMADLGFEKGCLHSVNWLGHDGTNGLFTADYSDRWRRLVDSYVEIFETVPQGKIALEPKPGDPAEDAFVRSAVHGLYLAHRIESRLGAEHAGRFGLNLEYGHEHLAGGKLAEALCLAMDENRLFQIDLNDNRKRWDTDHIPGNDNEQEVLEAEYWLYHRGFDGLWNFDLWPQRVAGETRTATLRRFAEHIVECINTVRYRRALIERMPGPDEMQGIFADPDETRVSRLLRDCRNQKIDFQESSYRP